MRYSRMLIERTPSPFSGRSHVTPKSEFFSSHSANGLSISFEIGGAIDASEKSQRKKIEPINFGDGPETRAVNPDGNRVEVKRAKRSSIFQSPFGRINAKFPHFLSLSAKKILARLWRDIVFFVMKIKGLRHALPIKVGLIGV